MTTHPSTMRAMEASTDIARAAETSAARISLAAEVARRMRWGHLGIGPTALVPVNTYDEEVDRVDSARRSGTTAFAHWWKTHAGNLAFKGSVILNVILGVGKVILGVMALSPFVVVNGLYSIGMGTARFFCLSTEDESMSMAIQYKRYRRIGGIIAVASLLFAAYGIRLFFSPDTTTYSSYVAIGIATVIFVEVGVGIHQVIARWHDPSPLVHAAKLAGLASALTGLALVQVALVSFADTSGVTRSNGYGGLFCGGLAAMIGIGMIVRATRALKGRPATGPVVEEDDTLSVSAPIAIRRPASLVPNFSERELAFLCDLAALDNPRPCLEAAPTPQSELAHAAGSEHPLTGETPSTNSILITN